MPPRIKVLLSIAVILTGLAVLYFERGGNTAHTGWIAFGLSFFMVFALWLFPEASGKKKDR